MDTPRRSFLSGIAASIFAPKSAEAIIDNLTDQRRRMLEAYVFITEEAQRSIQGSAVLIDPHNGWLALSAHQADLGKTINLKGSFSRTSHLIAELPPMCAKVMHASQSDQLGFSHDIALARIEPESMPILNQHLNRYPERSVLQLTDSTPEGATGRELFVAGYPSRIKTLLGSPLNPLQINNAAPITISINETVGHACNIFGSLTYPGLVAGGISGGGVFEFTRNNVPILVGIANMGTINAHPNHARLGFTHISALGPILSSLGINTPSAGRIAECQPKSFFSSTGLVP